MRVSLAQPFEQSDLLSPGPAAQYTVLGCGEAIRQCGGHGTAIGCERWQLYWWLPRRLVARQAGEQAERGAAASQPWSSITAWRRSAMGDGRWAGQAVAAKPCLSAAREMRANEWVRGHCETASASCCSCDGVGEWARWTSCGEDIAKPRECLVLTEEGMMAAGMRPRQAMPRRHVVTMVGGTDSSAVLSVFDV